MDYIDKFFLIEQVDKLKSFTKEAAGMSQRVLKTSEMVPGKGSTSMEVIVRSQIHEIHLWRVTPGEWIYPHTHPDSDDIWYIIQGKGDYYLSAREKVTVEAGDIAVATPGDVHGFFNSGSEDIVVYSILSPLPIEIDAVPGFEYPE